MRKNSNTAKLTEFEIFRDNAISKIRYIVEQHFGISHLNDCAKRTGFTIIIKKQVRRLFPAGGYQRCQRNENHLEG